ncbi:MAG: hypothetical protein EZS28_055801, partial [Streblomastix strix]
GSTSVSGNEEQEWKNDSSGIGNAALLVLGNKNDLEPHLSVEELVKKMELEKITDRDVSVYSISCKTASYIRETVNWLTDHSKSKMQSAYRQEQRRRLQHSNRIIHPI